MRFFTRPAKRIQAIPSIHTAFPARYNQNCATSPNESHKSTIEEGLEVVPIERSNSTCGKIVSPGTDDKELVSRSPLDLHIGEKPLPNLPHSRRSSRLRTRWKRLPAKLRIVILVGIQVIMVLILFGGLMSIKGSPLNRYAVSHFGLVYANNIR
jgi:hypothetical protein